MSENSRSQVTITLGRSGQVVKRAAEVVDSAIPNSHASVGTKRSIHDRLGGNGVLNAKRHRGDANTFTASSADGADDVNLRKDDLRYKIMRKNGNKRYQNDGLENGVDLREILSRQVRPSTSSVVMQQPIPEEKNGRQHLAGRNEVRHVLPEVRDVKQHMPEVRDVKQHMPEMRDVRYRMPEGREVRERMPEMGEVRERIPEMREVRERMPESREFRERVREIRDVRERVPEMMEVRERMPELREIRERIPETREVRQRIPEARGDRQRIPEYTSASVMGRIPSSRGVDAMPRIDSLRNSYSPWSLDRVRRRSPDGVLGNSRGISPPRNEEELRRRPVMRAYDDVRSAAYLSKDALELSRPMPPIGTASYMAKSAAAAGPAKPMGPLLAAPPPSVMVDEQRTIEGLLHTLGLGKYIINFKAEEVDMHALRQMRDNDLKELGIPMGPRKKILLALLPRSRRQM